MNVCITLLLVTRAASRGTPQASNDKRRHRNFFQTQRMQSVFKKVYSLEIRGQMMRSNEYRSSPASIYMLSVTDFDPKGTISEVRVHAGAKFRHTKCWSIAKCGFSMKFSKSFDHHGKTKNEIVKKLVSKNENLNILRDLWGNLMTCYQLRMRGWLCESCKRKVGKDSMNECSPGARSQACPHKSTLRVPVYCAGKVRGRVTRALVVVEPHTPPMINVGTETAFRHDHCKHFQKSKHLSSYIGWVKRKR